jgi:hypothetical protein
MPEILYKPNEELIDLIQTHYSRILDQAGLNVTDPVAANVGFFNTRQKVIVDPPRYSKTAVFFTRPNLNFKTDTNITRSKIFSYYKQSPLGCALMRQLMYGDTAGMMYYGNYGSDKEKVQVVGPCSDTFIGGEISNIKEY